MGRRVATRSVLIGTAETLPGLWTLVEASAHVDVAGVVLLGDSGPVLEAKAPVIALSELAALTEGDGRPEMAVVSLPSSASGLIGRVRRELRRCGLPERFVPPIDEMLTRTAPYAVGLDGGRVAPLSPAKMDLAALVGRAPHQPDAEAIRKVVAGKRVMVTGAGGSIGSELARICALHEPEQIVLVERAENALFEIDRQLAATSAGVERRAVLHDVVDEAGTMRLLDAVRPHAVFHAAAHKHVPLMEDHPAHALTNNLFGTKSIADASLACGAERFVMISTDKAVNPTSVMGATKRLAELYVMGLGSRGGTAASIVRFGNVLGSAASVLQIWAAQIADGGPLTVTDRRMTRYFMTIPEAAGLVIQAGSLAEGDRTGVYVLDMGDPVPILSLAERFVRAHGLRPRVVGAGQAVDGRAADEIEILVTGARPGEKLEEELAYASESLRTTGIAGVRAHLDEAHLPHAGPELLDDDALATLDRARHGEADTVVEAIRRHIPQLRSSDSGERGTPAGIRAA